MTITIHPSEPITGSDARDEISVSEPVSTVEEKNIELQKHLESVEYIDDKTQFLMFGIEQGDYALDILRVREILDIPPITKVPRTPDFMLGVINLRGSVVPVVDLRQRFGMEQADYTEKSCIIIVEIEGNGSKARVFGLSVDAVQEVISLSPDMINEVSKVGTNIDTNFLKGVGNYMENFVLIMDLAKVLPVNESF
ncbi:MAG: chemotaxis protein CheW [Proteobacteria bacterium]|nr:chemotaxis protein CheW [Pseudomonadota bacterium]